MSQVSPRASIFERRSCEASNSSQATTPTVQRTPGEIKRENQSQVTRRLLFTPEIQNSLERTTFLGQEQQTKRQIEPKPARRRRRKNLHASPQNVPHNYIGIQPNVVPYNYSGLQPNLVLQPSFVLQHENALLSATIDPSVQQPVIIPHNAIYPGIELLLPYVPCTGTTSNQGFEYGNQQLAGPVPCNRATYHRSSVRQVPYFIPERAASSHHGSQTINGSFTTREDVTQTTNETNDALLAMSQLLAEASDLQGAVVRGEIRIEKQTEPSNVVTVDRVVSSEQATKELVLENKESPTVEKKGEEKKVHELQSLQEIFGLDLSDTRALFEGTYNDTSIESMCDMYLPPEAPSVDQNVNEVLSSTEFLELMDLLDDNKPQSGTTKNNSDAQRMYASISDKHDDQESLSEICSSASVTASKGGKRVRLEQNASDPCQDYTPDMFLFTSIEPEVKFDLFDHDFDCVSSDDVTTVMTSRKRKRCFSDVISKRARGNNWLSETLQGAEAVY